MTASIDNIVFEGPDGTWTGERWEGPIRSLALFYAELLGMRIVREDWLLVGHARDVFPRLAFDPSPNHRPPVAGDPQRPRQVHLDIAVTDLEEAESLALGSGATPLERADDRRTYADPAGHPFCLLPGGDPGHGRIERIVFDCSDPRAEAAFYEDLTGMRRRVVDTPEHIVIGREDGELPMLAFERIPDYVAPRWPDPAYPQQIHLDLFVDEPAGALESARQLGATRLRDMGGSCPVFADPAGHPFCLCAPGQ
jgi:catechol 2,3-dioxygenase-like lactoylglutathione lyase family enzyme